MRHLTAGATGPDVRALQRALNQRARARHLDQVAVDGEYGPQTDKLARRVAWRLGAHKSTIGQPGCTIGEQRMIRWPALRSPAQLVRARRRAKASAKAARGPAAALREARRYIGKTEQPPGSNTAPWGLSAWIRELLGLGYGVAWCGIFVGHCLQAAGVKVTGRVAAVAYIHADARAGRNGFAHLVGIRDGRAGDAVGLFGLSTHVELIEKRVPGGYQTIGGNTSPGSSGSQSNGGGCYRRMRPYAHVVYVARPAYPGA